MRRIAAWAVLVAFVAAGCGDDKSAPTADDPRTPTPPASPTATRVTPSASSSSSSADSSISPSTADPPSHIPDGFPLAAGWPRRVGEPNNTGLSGPNRTLPPVELAPCDVPADDPEFADRLRADWSDIEDYRHRQLTLYRTEVAASEAVRAIIEVYESCTEDFDGHSRTTYVLEPTSYGDESWSVAATEAYDGGPTSYLGVRHVIRVGRAVLVTVDHNEGGAGPPGSLERNVRQPAAEAERVIDAICVFTADGC